MTTDTLQALGAPPTGAQYLAGLRDGRRVWIEGEPVADVTEHRAFRNSARSIARLYDALRDPALAPTLTAPLDTGEPGFTHRFFRVARRREDLVAAQGAIAAWSRLTFGWMGRTPDYKAALTSAMGANPDFFGPFAANATRWYTLAQRRVPFLSHAMVNPPIDRHKPAHECADVIVRVTRETDAGIVVSGAKVVATGAALTNAVFVGSAGKAAIDDPSMAVAFFVPIATPGVRLICRRSYEAAAAGASPFDHPLASRFDENDAILVLDEVFVPWQDVLIHRDPLRARAFSASSGFLNNFLFHGCTRLAVKLDFAAGLLSHALHTTGGDEFRGNQALLGEVVAWRHLMWSLSNAMACNPEPWGSSAVLPERQAAIAYSVFAPQCWPRLTEIVERTVASALIYLPSSAADVHAPELAPDLARFLRGSHGVGPERRIRTMKLLWEAVGSEFAARHRLYECNYAGSWEDVRLQALGEAERSGRMQPMRDFADECMEGYSTAGFTDATWARSEAAGASASGGA